MASGFERLVEKRRRHPGIGQFIPGLGGPAYIGNYSPDTPPVPGGRQQAPFKPGQTRRIQRLKRPTRPQRYANPHSPRTD